VSASGPGALRAYAGLGARILDARLRPGRPFKVTWMLTDRCDCRCVGCRIWEQKKRRELTAEEIGRALAAAPSVRWLNLTGGEPFLRDDLPEIAAAAHAALPGLVLLDFPTTGQRHEAIVAGCRRIAALGIPRVYVTVSVEGPPALHDRLRGRPGAFENALKTFAALRFVPGLRCWLGMTLNEQNADTVDEMLAAAREHAPDATFADVHFNVYTVSGHYYANEGAPLKPPPALGETLRRAIRARSGSANPADLIEAAYLRLLPKYLRTGRSPLPCESVRASVFIDTVGDVFPCTVYGRVLGNLREQTLGEILRGAEARDARDVVRRDACPGCWSPCEAFPTIVAQAPASLLAR
jgi:MoaA/NifB/PqqE/SkfB family radical SAM enzyme